MVNTSPLRGAAVLGLLLLALSAPVFAQQEDRWNKLQADGMTALNENRFADAEKLFAECVTLAESIDDKLLPPSLNNLALAYENEGRYADAEPLYRRAISTLEKLDWPESGDSFS